MIIKQLKTWHLQNGFHEYFRPVYRFGGSYFIRGKKLGPETRELGLRLGRLTVKTWYHPNYKLNNFKLHSWGWDGFRTFQIVLFNKEFRLTVELK